MQGYTKYESKSYHTEIQTGVDRIIVNKSNRSDWCDIYMITNRANNGHITLRGKEAAEGLRFMLNRLLEED